MSKISYCSLEEAWGDMYVKNNKNTEVSTLKDMNNNNIYNRKYD